MNPETCDENLDRLWKEYSQLFEGYDDLSLMRWMSQTLGQLRGNVIRLSHPLIGAYRVAASIAMDRDLWSQRLLNFPTDYVAAECCGTPVLPVFSRDVFRNGLICEHCNETLVPFESLPDSLKPDAETWAEKYDRFHQVSHWSDDEKAGCADYDQELERAVEQCKSLLVSATRQMLPHYLEHFPTILWEDHDECLGIKPDEVLLN